LQFAICNLKSSEAWSRREFLPQMDTDKSQRRDAKNAEKRGGFILPQKRHKAAKILAANGWRFRTPHSALRTWNGASILKLAAE
jgi:hypothetical protein